MKKRLSSERWNLAIIVISYIGLLFILNHGMRAANLGHAYNAVPGEIPVLPVPIKDPAFNRYAEKPRKNIAATTAAIILNANGDFYFGDLTAFSSEYHQVRNKFQVPHADGQPQMAQLLERLRQWQYQRKTSDGVSSDGLVVFLPASTVPLSLVIQVIAELRSSAFFDDVILANGLI